MHVALDASDRQAILKEIKLGCESGPGLVDQVADAWRRDDRWLAAGALGALAERIGLIEGDTDAMWRGLRQAARLRWVATTLSGGYLAKQQDAGTHLRDVVEAVAAGDREVFERWLALVPRTLEAGQRSTVILTNAFTAWGHDDAELRDAVRLAAQHGLQLASEKEYDKAIYTVVEGWFAGDAEGVSEGLARAVALDGRNKTPWDPRFLASTVIALFNAARSELADPIAAPLHARFLEPPAMGAPLEAGLADFSRRVPAIETWWRELPESIDPKSCVVLDAKDDPKEQTEEAFLSAVYAAPDDDGPRYVFSDWLREKGDPRGEFIALQLRAAAGEKLKKPERERERSLLELNGKTWLGPLRDHGGLSNIAYTRGFVASCQAQRLEPLEAFATLSELHGMFPGDDVPLRGLRVLGSLWNLDGLKERTQPLLVRELAYAGASFLEPPDLDNAALLPHLEDLWILGQRDWVRGADVGGETRMMGPDDLDWLWSSAWAPTLKSLTCPVPCAELSAFATSWLGGERALEELTVSTQAGRQWDHGWQLRVRSVADGWALHLAAAPKPPKGKRARPQPSFAEALLEGLAGLPRDHIHEATADPSAKKSDEGKALIDALGSPRFADLPRRTSWWT